MRLKLISCEVLFREMCDALARSPHQIDVEFLPKGLHDLGGAAMARELQSRIDFNSDPARYDTLLLGYALCGNGLHGLTARSLPLIAPRAHDCIALLLGSRERYLQLIEEEPGTYFRSTGWIERGSGLEQLVMNRTGVGFTLDQFIERYGDDNGRYLYAELTRYQSNYSRLVFIETGLESGPHFQNQARAEAGERNWRFESVPGSLSLFHQLASGPWEPDLFLTVPPGHRITASHDSLVIHATPPSQQESSP